MAIEFTLTEQFDAPTERVYDVMTGVDAWSEWMPNLVRIETLTDAPFGVGTRWREVRRMFGREAGEVFEVTALEPGRQMELFVDGALGSSRSGEYRFVHTLEPHGGGTLLTLRGEIGGMSKVMEIIGKVFAGSMKKAIARDLAAMKTFVEAGAA